MFPVGNLHIQTQKGLTPACCRTTRGLSYDARYSHMIDPDLGSGNLNTEKLF